MLLALHTGSSQPSLDMLSPVVEKFVKYHNEPISIVVKQEERKFYVRLLLFVADAPARSAVLNFKQHNSYYGCHLCFTKFYYNKMYKTMRYILFFIYSR